MLKVITKASLSIILLLSLVACSSTDKELSPEEKKADVYFSYGTQSLMRGEYTNALDGLLKSNELRPRQPDTINNLAMAYYYKKRKSKALELLKTTLDLAPDHSDAKINLASIYLNDNKLEEAKKLYLEVLEDLLYKRQFITHSNLGKIYLQQGNLDQALIETEKAISEAEGYCPALLQKGRILMMKKDYGAAEKALEISIKGTCYQNVRAHYYKGLNLMKMRRYVRAEEVMEKIRVDFAKTGFAPLAILRLKEIRKNKRMKDISSLRIDTPEF